MKVPRDGDRSRSATPYNLRPLRDRITEEHSSQTGRINGGTKTSDYSSGDEDRTPTPVPKPPPRTPLSRSAEKTDYTYARSHSYRAQVTPQRVIVMPNMSRRSIERRADTYSSPPLRSASSAVASSSAAASASSTSGARTFGFSYGTDYDSEVEAADSEGVGYRLSTPPPPRRHVVAAASRASMASLRRLGWWIYLTVCRSLITDAQVLQWRLLSGLRRAARRRAPQLRLLLLLFVALPLAFHAGSFLLSALGASLWLPATVDSPAAALERATATTDTPQPAPLAPSAVPSPQLGLPKVADPPAATLERTSADKLQLGPSEAESPAPPLPVDATVAHLEQRLERHEPCPTSTAEVVEAVESDLRAALERVDALERRTGCCDETLTAMAVDFDSLKAELAEARRQRDDCCAQASADSVASVVDAKWSLLVGRLSGADTTGADDVTASLAAALAALPALQQRLQLVEDAATKKELWLQEQLSGLQERVRAGQAEILEHVRAEIDRTLPQVDADSQLRVRQLDDRLTEEIRDRFDRVASRAASLAAEVSHASAASAAASAAASSAASAAETSAADAASAAAAALTAADAASAALTAASAATRSVDVATPPTPTGDALSREQIEGIVRDALATYDADKTGVADYALEPAGGSVLSTRCTESFAAHRPRLSLWGVSLWSEPNNPRVVIQPGLVPGRCWSFRGFDGYLVVRLSRTVRPQAFSLEHIPRRLAPDRNIDSAPKHFSVYGLTQELQSDGGVLLGQYVYDQFGDALQTFPVQKENVGAFPIVELRIHSNHGHRNYTCLYRFRVHGQVFVDL